MDGGVLSANVCDDAWLKRTFNQRGHKFKKAVLRYLALQGAQGGIAAAWSRDDVVRSLYFAESSLVQRALIESGIDGAKFAELGKKGFTKELKNWSADMKIVAALEAHMEALRPKDNEPRASTSASSMPSRTSASAKRARRARRR